MGADDFVVVDEKPGAFSFGRWRNLAVNVWWSQATGPALERLTAHTRKMMREHADGFSSIHLVVDGAGLPDAEVRASFVRLTTECSRELACVAVVIGGSGFWAGALRSVVTGIWQLMPKDFEMRICGGPEEVLEWLPPRHLQRTGTHLPRPRLEAVLRAAVAPADGASNMQA